ncbi:MAG TPA: hypothetical protein VK881_07075 [bacterium]|nr:hypothetical protein [bacterium]
MRQLLAVAVFGSILAFTASAALAEGNVDPRLLQSPGDQLITSTTDTPQGVMAGPNTIDGTFVNNHEK